MSSTNVNAWDYCEPTNFIRAPKKGEIVVRLIPYKTRRFERDIQRIKCLLVGTR